MSDDDMIIPYDIIIYISRKWMMSIKKVDIGRMISWTNTKLCKLTW